MLAEDPDEPSTTEVSAAILPAIVLKEWVRTGTQLSTRRH